jgi:general secretion pathway protein D
LGVLGDVITIAGIQFPSLAAVIRYLQTDADFHILSTPQLLTTDNEEAEIVVAENRPFLTRVDTTADVTGREFANFEFRDVGVTLNITPQINQERFVRLKISQELSEVVSEAQVGLPTTLKRTANTTVVVQDGSTIVIGGLIQRTLEETEYKVPCLGNIPGLGWLFKSVEKSDGFSNLLKSLTTGPTFSSF